MKPRPKLRKILKWTGLATSVLIVVIWFASRWIIFTVGGGSNRITTANGTVWFLHWEHLDQVYSVEGVIDAYRVRSDNQVWNWTFQIERDSLIKVVIPLWALFAVSCAATVVVWRNDARFRDRARAGYCAKCGYDKRGAGDKCPECGEPGLAQGTKA